MSEPITWRSVSAPNFGASAALLNSGTETVNQGITSLAALAKGYADEQKGIAVSNAVADLSNATNDADLGSAFAAHSANLKDHGIDLKDLIAARQAQHKTLQGDATFKSAQELSASNLAGNVLDQANQGIKNKTDQGELDYQKTDQEQKIAAAAQGILESNSNMRTNESQASSAALSARSSAAHNDAATKALGDAALEKERVRNSALAYDKFASDPTMFSLDPKTRKPVLDQNKIHDAWVANGGNPLDLILGRETYKSMLETDKKEKAAALESTRDYEQSNILLEQNAQDSYKEREAAILSLSATLPTGLFGGTEDQNSGIATIRAAASQTFTDSDGHVAKVPMSIINAAKQAAAPNNGDLSGEGKLTIFNNVIDNYVKEHAQAQGKPRGKINADGKSRARVPD